MTIDYPVGRPAQFLLSAPDVSSVVDFYCAVLGWSTSGEGVFTLRGEPVARFVRGVGGWLPYLTVDELEPALVEVRAAGGTGGEPLLGPLGRTAVVVDPTATPLGLWESGSGPAARVWGQSGAVVWVEQKTRDQEAAQVFLAAVFGHAFVGPSGPGAVRVVKAESPLFGGVMQMDDRWAADIAPHWLLYLRTEDLDATVRRAEQAGGHVWFPAFDTPLGRMAYLRDPAGNPFAVVTVSERGATMIAG